MSGEFWELRKVKFHEFHAAVVLVPERSEICRGGAEEDSETSARETLPELKKR